MLTRRIIPCLDVKDGRVVKGVRFEELRDAGDPVEQARAYGRAGADELCFLDISASLEARGTLVALVERVARELSIPFAVGGGVRTVEDAEALLRAGADKVSMNTAALADPGLLTAVARLTGSQSALLAIDAKRLPGPRPAWEVHSHGGTRPTGRDAVAWAREAVDRGAGEILLTSIDRDGTGAGFELELTRTISAAVPVPVIASGGAGGPAHFAEAFAAGASAALAATVFHFGTLSVAQVKEECARRGFPMRWPLEEFDSGDRLK
ncbi:MAG TPA: imidazole glycerol phosphate synthase subunit HisF [Myxococcales bacterium]